MDDLGERNHRILVVDDNSAIHADFKKIFAPAPAQEVVLGNLESALFGAPAPTAPEQVFELHSAFQGEEGLKKVQEGRAAGQPFSVVFLDVRMPPGWDGVETADHLWKVDPELQIVLCTAYSDYSWEQTLARLGVSDRLLILKKPFDTIEVKQLAHALTEKWALGRQARLKMDELEVRVQARTRELASVNEELRKQMAARERMEGALRRAQKFESLGQLVAGIAHEVNNPLAFVTSSLAFFNDELQAGEKSFRELPMTEAMSAVKEGLNGAQRIQRIVHDLTPFKRLRDDSFEAVTLEPCVDLATKQAASALGTKAKVVKHLEHAPRVKANAARLNVVFYQLLMNAAQATVDDGISPKEISVTARTEGSRALIEIVDEGQGMKPDVLERIFDPFFTTRPIGSGTGLGLTVVHEFMAVFGGDITVTSEPGKGTTVKMYLPLAELEMVPSPDDVKLAAAG